MSAVALQADGDVAGVQGSEDKVVPPNQAEIMFDGLKERGIMTSLTMYEGEQHGFRGASAIRRTLDGVLDRQHNL